MRFVSFFIGVLVSLFISGKAHANDPHDRGIVPAPDRGIVYNTKETNAVVYFCEKTGNNALACEFTQTRVLKKAKIEDLKAKLDNARKLFQSDENEEEDLQACNDIKEFSQVLQGHKQGQNKTQQEKISGMSEMEKKDLINLSKILEAYCNSKTLENYLAMARASFDRETRTCTVSSNTWKQSFRIVKDQVSGAFTWVAKGEPSGACGVIQLSRFEPEKLDNSEFFYWNYIAKKVVTNKQGVLFPGMACNNLDENEYIFDWKSKEHGLGCDYIEFSPF